MDKIRLRPSSSGKWLICTASPIVEAALPDDAGEAAHEGTAAHYLAEQCLRFVKDAAYYLDHEIVVVTLNRDTDAIWTAKFNGVGKVVYRVTVDTEMAGYVQKYLDYVRELTGPNTTLYTEQPLNKDADSILSGTCDAAVVDRGTETIHMLDLKYGFTPVYARSNPQLLTYGYLFRGTQPQKYASYNLVLHVIQPRANNITHWEVPADDLLEFERRLDGVLEKYSSQPVAELRKEFTPGDHCVSSYCRGRHTCYAYQDYMSGLGNQFEKANVGGTEIEVATVPPNPLTPEGLMYYYERVKLFRVWCDSIEEQVINLFRTGQYTDPRFKLVRGRGGNRGWDDKEVVTDLLKSMKVKIDVAFPRGLITPAQVDKAAKTGDIGPRQFDKLVEHMSKSEGKLTVVPVDDPRESVAPSLEGFEVIASPDDVEGFDVIEAVVEVAVVTEDDDPFDFI